MSKISSGRRISELKKQFKHFKKILVCVLQLVGAPEGIKLGLGIGR